MGKKRAIAEKMSRHQQKHKGKSVATGKKLCSAHKTGSKQVKRCNCLSPKNNNKKVNKVAKVTVKKKLSKVNKKTVAVKLLEVIKADKVSKKKLSSVRELVKLHDKAPKKSNEKTKSTTETTGKKISETKRNLKCHKKHKHDPDTCREGTVRSSRSRSSPSLVLQDLKHCQRRKSMPLSRKGKYLARTRGKIKSASSDEAPAPESVGVPESEGPTKKARPVRSKLNRRHGMLLAQTEVSGTQSLGSPSGSKAGGTSTPECPCFISINSEDEYSPRNCKKRKLFHESPGALPCHDGAEDIAEHSGTEDFLGFMLKTYLDITDDGVKISLVRDCWSESVSSDEYSSVFSSVQTNKEYCPVSEDVVSTKCNGGAAPLEACPLQQREAHPRTCDGTEEVAFGPSMPREAASECVNSQKCTSSSRESLHSAHSIEHSTHEVGSSDVASIDHRRDKKVCKQSENMIEQTVISSRHLSVMTKEVSSASESILTHCSPELHRNASASSVVRQVDPDRHTLEINSNSLQHCFSHVQNGDDSVFSGLPSEVTYEKTENVDYKVKQRVNRKLSRKTRSNKRVRKTARSLTEDVFVLKENVESCSNHEKQEDSMNTRLKSLEINSVVPALGSNESSIQQSDNSNIVRSEGTKTAIVNGELYVYVSGNDTSAKDRVDSLGSSDPLDSLSETDTHKLESDKACKNVPIQPLGDVQIECSPTKVEKPKTVRTSKSQRSEESSLGNFFTKIELKPVGNKDRNITSSLCNPESHISVEESVDSMRPNCVTNYGMNVVQKISAKAAMSAKLIGTANKAHPPDIAPKYVTKDNTSVLKSKKKHSESQSSKPRKEASVKNKELFKPDRRKKVVISSKNSSLTNERVSPVLDSVPSILNPSEKEISAKPVSGSQKHTHSSKPNNVASGSRKMGVKPLPLLNPIRKSKSDAVGENTANRVAEQHSLEETVSSVSDLIVSDEISHRQDKNNLKEDPERLDFVSVIGLASKGSLVQKDAHAIQYQVTKNYLCDGSPGVSEKCRLSNNTPSGPCNSDYTANNTVPGIHSSRRDNSGDGRDSAAGRCKINNMLSEKTVAHSPGPTSNTKESEKARNSSSILGDSLLPVSLKRKSRVVLPSAAPSSPEVLPKVRHELKHAFVKLSKKLQLQLRPPQPVVDRPKSSKPPLTSQIDVTETVTSSLPTEAVSDSFLVPSSFPQTRRDHKVQCRTAPIEVDDKFSDDDDDAISLFASSDIFGPEFGHEVKVTRIGKTLLPAFLRGSDDESDEEEVGRSEKKQEAVGCNDADVGATAECVGHDGGDAVFSEDDETKPADSGSREATPIYEGDSDADDHTHVTEPLPGRAETAMDVPAGGTKPVQDAVIPESRIVRESTGTMIQRRQGICSLTGLHKELPVQGSMCGPRSQSQESHTGATQPYKQSPNKSQSQKSHMGVPVQQRQSSGSQTSNPVQVMYGPRSQSQRIQPRIPVQPRQSPGNPSVSCTDNPAQVTHGPRSQSQRIQPRISVQQRQSPGSQSVTCQYNQAQVMHGSISQSQESRTGVSAPFKQILRSQSQESHMEVSVQQRQSLGSQSVTCPYNQAQVMHGSRGQAQESHTGVSAPFKQILRSQSQESHMEVSVQQRQSPGSQSVTRPYNQAHVMHGPRSQSQESRTSVSVAGMRSHSTMSARFPLVDKFERKYCSSVMETGNCTRRVCSDIHTVPKFDTSEREGIMKMLKEAHEKSFSHAFEEVLGQFLAGVGEESEGLPADRRFEGAYEALGWMLDALQACGMDCGEAANRMAAALCDRKTCVGPVMKQCILELVAERDVVFETYQRVRMVTGDYADVVCSVHVLEKHMSACVSRRPLDVEFCKIVVNLFKIFDLQSDGNVKVKPELIQTFCRDLESIGLGGDIPRHVTNHLQVGLPIDRTAEMLESNKEYFTPTPKSICSRTTVLENHNEAVGSKLTFARPHTSDVNGSLSTNHARDVSQNCDLRKVLEAGRRKRTQMSVGCRSNSVDVQCSASDTSEGRVSTGSSNTQRSSPAKPSVISTPTRVSVLPAQSAVRTSTPLRHPEAPAVEPRTPFRPKLNRRSWPLLGDVLPGPSSGPLLPRPLSQGPPLEPPRLLPPQRPLLPTPCGPVLPARPSFVQQVEQKLRHDLDLVHDCLIRGDYQTVARILDERKATPQSSEIARQAYQVLKDEVNKMTTHYPKLVEAAVARCSDCVMRACLALIGVSSMLYLCGRHKWTAALVILNAMYQAQVDPHRVTVEEDGEVCSPTRCTIGCCEVLMNNRCCVKAAKLLYDFRLLNPDPGLWLLAHRGGDTSIRNELCKYLFQRIIGEDVLEAVKFFQTVYDSQSSCGDPIDMKTGFNDLLVGLLDGQRHALALDLYKRFVPEVGRVDDSTVRAMLCIAVQEGDLTYAEVIWRCLCFRGVYFRSMGHVSSCVQVKSFWLKEEMYMALRHHLQQLTDKFTLETAASAPEEEFKIYLVVQKESVAYDDDTPAMLKANTLQTYAVERAKNVLRYNFQPRISFLPSASNLAHTLVLSPEDVRSYVISTLRG
ncbi:uncharacterized protein LOC134542478 isoform X2 [Bacillus rossius redtenbacheri]|uniref:uncharacterized protein LOC134542478 isoform X2 n=1 Tax=Bacillus rossius redtenbacheri TaxID=93214 RepID=UPI002FDE3D1E